MLQHISSNDDCISVSDYVSDSEDLYYIFTKSIIELPIRIELVDNWKRELTENFMICLPDAQALQSMGAETVEPSCTTIVVIDDDCKTL